MAFSFDSELLDPVSRMRDAVGNRNSADQLKPDETYEGYLRLYSIPLTASMVALGEKKATRDMLRAIAAEVGRRPSDARSGAGEGATWNHRVPTWLRLADALDKEIKLEEDALAVVTGAGKYGGRSLLPSGPTYTGV